MHFDSMFAITACIIFIIYNNILKVGLRGCRSHIVLKGAWFLSSWSNLHVSVYINAIHRNRTMNILPLTPLYFSFYEAL